MPRFSANLNFLFTELPFLDRFGAAARAGFRAVEFPDPYSYDLHQLRLRLSEHDLRCVLLNMPMGDAQRGDKGVACLPDRRDEFRDSVALALDRARQLGCTRLNCMAGRASQENGAPDAAEMRATLVDNLRFAAAQAARADVALDLEPLNTRDVPDFFVTDSRQAVSIIRQVGAPNLALQFDCYHLEIMEGNIMPLLTELAPLVGHIQIADVPGRHEPGSGRIDFAALFALIDRLDYPGWVGAEYLPATTTEAGLDWFRGLSSRRD